jgi:ankyrin repeat protein
VCSSDLLLEKGADINTRTRRGWTALMGAAFEGNLKIVELLLEKGADLNTVTRDGWTAYKSAEMAGHTRIARLLSPDEAPRQEEKLLQ